eukprot:5891625-Lingulodinium_polyedra.AAC.1
MLAHRALLHQARHMFKATREEKYLQKLESKLGSLSKRQPQKAVGRHAFLAWLFEQVKAQHAGAPVSASTKKAIMQQHSQMFQGLSPAEQVHFNQVASEAAKRKAGELQEDADHLKAAMFLFKSRQQEEAEETGTRALAGAH